MYPRRHRRRSVAPALMALVAVGAAAAAGSGRGGSAPAAGSPAGLAYSRASAEVVQPQSPAGSCHASGSGLMQLPDRRCTPGALNPAVTPASIGATICRSGWTGTVRPPESVTGKEKRGSMAAYGRSGASRYEYDHLVPLELGGAVNDPRNLWPEPDYPRRAGFYLNPKDRLESALRRQVCSGALALSVAQRAIAGNWVAAYARYAAR